MSSHWLLVLKDFCPVIVQSEQCQKRSVFLICSAITWTVMCLFKQAGQWSSKLNAAISILNLMIWMYIRPFSQALGPQVSAHCFNIKHKINEFSFLRNNKTEMYSE